MDARKLIEAIGDAGYEAGPYSGRGMFGKYCVSVGLQSGVSSFTFALELAVALMDLESDEDRAFVAIDDLKQLAPREDSLGRGSIIYFPQVEWPKDGSVEE